MLQVNLIITYIVSTHYLINAHQWQTDTENVQFVGCCCCCFSRATDHMHVDRLIICTTTVLRNCWQTILQCSMNQLAYSQVARYCQLQLVIMYSQQASIIQINRQQTYVRLTVQRQDESCTDHREMQLLTELIGCD